MTFPDPNAQHVSMQPTDTTVVWSGQSEDLTNLATGGRLSTAAYKLTRDGLHFEAGVLSRTAEVIPLWAVLDVDLRQSLTQRARSVADLVVRLDPKGYKYGQTLVVLRSIRGAEQVRTTIIQQANTARATAHQFHHQLEIQRRQAGASQVNVGVMPQGVPQGTAPQGVVPQGLGAPAPAALAAAPGDDLLTRLERLAALHSSGALTAEEFTAAKAKLLS
ncbi:SHOCT domain-containing protein [Longispora sp. NPDC051575]|uniref:SHOCT domain-containing protein n=1 Tax=Longispora sp. NPDC051575 TaxID=3154943 RepID=UPI00341A4777